MPLIPASRYLLPPGSAADRVMSTTPSSSGTLHEVNAFCSEALLPSEPSGTANRVNPSCLHIGWSG
jgi:hypothetical protein